MIKWIYRNKLSSLVLIFVVLQVSFPSLKCHGFLNVSPSSRTNHLRPVDDTFVKPCSTIASQLEATKIGQDKEDDISFLMEKYRDPANPQQIIDPYKILKISRRAERQEIKQAYRNLSRRYHPDGLINKDILPGSCNNLDDVRNHWERVKLSYEILSDPISRKRYDRNEAWADPGNAVKRAATQAAVDAAVSVGKGVWGLGASMVSGVVKAATGAGKDKDLDKDQRNVVVVGTNSSDVTSLVKARQRT